MNRVKGISWEDKKPLVFYDIDVQDNTFTVYDGKRQYKISNETFHEYKRRPRTSPYLLVKCDEKQKLKERYDHHIQQTEALKEFTKGQMNLYRTGSLPKAVLFYFFKQMNKLSLCPEKIGEEEGQWLEEATRGALMYAEDGYRGKAYSYDFSSYYLSILSDGYFKVPMKQGTFYTYTEEEFQRLEYLVNTYIYRVKLTEPKNTKNHWYKLVRFKKDGFKYTYWVGKELIFLKKLGFEIDIIDDGKPNCLKYESKECKTGKKVFRKTCQFLYKIKQNPSTKDSGKSLSVCLWGGLCQGNTITMSFKKNETIDIGRMYEGVFRNKDIIRFEETPQRVRYTWRDIKSGYFTYPWARIKPFMTAWGRVKMGEMLLPMSKRVIRIHTDGFYLSSPISKKVEVVKESEKEKITLGCLKYEWYSKEVVVKNVNRIEGKPEKKKA